MAGKSSLLFFTVSPGTETYNGLKAAIAGVLPGLQGAEATVRGAREAIAQARGLLKNANEAGGSVKMEAALAICAEVKKAGNGQPMSAKTLAALVDDLLPGLDKKVDAGAYAVRSKDRSNLKAVLAISCVADRAKATALELVKEPGPDGKARKLFDEFMATARVLRDVMSGKVKVERTEGDVKGTKSAVEVNASDIEAHRPRKAKEDDDTPPDGSQPADPWEVAVDAVSALGNIGVDIAPLLSALGEARKGAGLPPAEAKVEETPAPTGAAGELIATGALASLL